MRMPEKVLIIGSGALKIGEAGEFDYSGSQAIKALKEEGIETILINPNIATVQTSEGMADRTYFIPVTAEFVERIIEKERPDAILLTFGGQTALNCGVELHRKGVLEKNRVKVLGTPVEAIINTEDREKFALSMSDIDVKTVKSYSASDLDEALKAIKETGYPVIVRSAYTLGGLGSGFCKNRDELEELCLKAFSHSNQIIIEKSLKGWKEIEYEVMRDSSDNCITVCNMENFDPLGIHTGESIVVAPSQTLSNDEYHFLRETAIKIVRHIGVVGECNVQYALDPESEDYRVIEVNARLSRSSALASKATGYPIASVAAKLSLGYGLWELKNSMTGTSSACFEPSLDYIVCKIPRWDLEKFPGVSREIGSSMKSVGEIMAVGRSFEEVIQKGLRMAGLGIHGFVGNRNMDFDNPEEALMNPTDLRIFAIASAFAKGMTVEYIHKLTKIDLWFLVKLQSIFTSYNELKQINRIEDLPVSALLEFKKNGFSDFQIARAVFKSSSESIEQDMAHIREYRKKSGVIPVVKQIDTTAAEYPASSNYLYLTYHGSVSDIEYDNCIKAIGVLGSGAYRIGSSVEFDWCSVNTVNTIRKNGKPAFMINHNPETVSTDFDICERLYFEELSFERVMDIYDFEQPEGLILSVGGQIPNNLALRLGSNSVKILGTQPDSIDCAENRFRFSALMDKLGIDQPDWKELTSVEELEEFIKKVSYPVLIRPSYVLSGAAMNVVSNPGELNHFLSLAKEVSKQHPVVVTDFIENAKEIEIDAVADKGRIVAYAISEHVEFAGVHSGDATMVFPPQKIYFETVRRIKRISAEIAEALQISGPFNIQFLAKDNGIKVIECNLRASRTVPFVSKVLKFNFIELATSVMTGSDYEVPSKSIFDLDYIGVKASQFSFARLQQADPILGVNMSSTGEVGCMGRDFHDALLKAMISAGYRVPEKSILLSTGTIKDKVELLEPCRLLAEKGFNLYATKGTAEFLRGNGIEATVLHWPDEDKHPNSIEYIRHGLGGSRNQYPQESL